jgi:hypothetical protein
VVNNRRAVVEVIDVKTQHVTLQWTDILHRQAERRRLQQENVDDGNDAADVGDDNDEYLVLTIFNFAFKFVPGFCVTAHLAQGETIREH